MSNLLKETSTYKVIVNKNGIQSIRLKTSKNGRLAKKNTKEKRKDLSTVFREALLSNGLTQSLEKFNKDKDYKSKVFKLLGAKLSEIETVKKTKASQNDIDTVVSEFIAPAINSNTIKTVSITVDESKLLTV